MTDPEGNTFEPRDSEQFDNLVRMLEDPYVLAEAIEQLDRCEARREHALDIALRIRGNWAAMPGSTEVAALIADATAIEAFLRDGKQSSS